MTKTENQTGLNLLKKALIELELKKCLDLAKKLVENKISPFDILASCEVALSEIGTLYAKGDYYIAGLLMAGEIVNRIISYLTPFMGQKAVITDQKIIVIGTVKGDIHDLGKNIAGALLKAYGFKVIDLGVDLRTEDFLEAVRKNKPDIVGLSVLLSSCHGNLGQTIKSLREERGKSKKPVLIISGAQITENHCQLYLADYFALNAFDTVKLCEKIVTEKNSKIK
jgi:methanogenic corrinoid protein MtbC1